jgi:hypothetical protein
MKVFSKTISRGSVLNLELGQQIIWVLPAGYSSQMTYVIMEDDEHKPNDVQVNLCSISTCFIPSYKNVELHNHWNEPFIVSLCKMHYDIATHNLNTGDDDYE